MIQAADGAAKLRRGQVQRGNTCREVHVGPSPVLFMAMVAFLLRTSSILIIAPVSLVVYGGTATLLGAIPREDMHMLYRSIRSKGERSSTEIQTNVVDENVFDRTTQSLPAMTVRIAHPELTIESEFASESDATTAYLPSVVNDTTVPLPSIVNDIRAPLPTVRARRIQPKVKIRKVRIQPEVVEE